MNYPVSLLRINSLSLSHDLAGSSTSAGLLLHRLRFMFIQSRRGTINVDGKLALIYRKAVQ
jgi:hypothetical protein